MKIQNAFRLGLIGSLGVGLGVLIIMSIVSLSTILTYIGAALFLALGLEPVVAFLERHGFKRWLALLTALVVLLAVIAGLLWAIVPVIVDQSTQAVEGVTEWVQSGAALDLFHQLQVQFPAIISQDNLDAVVTYVQEHAGSIGGGVLQVGIGIVSGIFGALIVGILMIYFTASLPAIKRSSYQLVPATKRARFAELADQITDSVGKYVMGQVSLALCNGILSAIFLSIIGAKFAILLAVVAFLFSLIPLVGTITGSVIIVLACLATSPATAVAALVYYLIYMQVEAYVLSPRIMNRAVSVPGAVVVIAALAGGSLLGILGALVAIPVAASILLIIQQVVVPRQNEL
ncbi:MAG: AI-2E family transporter [Leifsonia sp.]